MKKLILLLPVIASILAHGQGINAGPDTVACPGNYTFNAVVTGNSSSNSYTITQITYAPFSFTTGTMVSLSDDAATGALPIGFTFSFMGNSYTQFHIGSNGWVAFSPQTTSPTLTPLNCIMGAFHDLNPANGGAIRYNTSGTAPNRRLVVSWSQVPLYSCGTPVTQQIVLYEGTNIIDNYFQDKPVCATWSNGNAIQGVHNATGTIAFTVPGRNCTQWAVTNQGWRFTPGSASAFGPVMWYNAAGSFVGSGNSYTANVTGSTFYVASVYDTTTATTYYDTVNISIGIPGLTVAVTNPSCANNTNGSAVATAPGGPYTYAWSTGATTSSVTGLGTGTYSVTVSNSSGCTETVTFTISPLALLNVFATSAGETCLGCNNGIAYSYPSGGTPPYTYVWQPGGATTKDYYNIAPGTYTVCITDANNCTVCDSVTVDPANVGIEERDAAPVFGIVPNPVTGNEVKIVLSKPLKSDASVTVVDVTGAEVYAGRIIAGSGKSEHLLTFQSLPPGIYFIRLRADDVSQSRKLVKYE
jgi:hypothetical protein